VKATNLIFKLIGRLIEYYNFISVDISLQAHELIYN